MYSSALKHVYARQLSSGEHAARILHNTSTSGSEVLQAGGQRRWRQRHWRGGAVRREGASRRAHPQLAQLLPSARLRDRPQRARARRADGRRHSAVQAAHEQRHVRHAPVAQAPAAARRPHLHLQAAGRAGGPRRGRGRPHQRRRSWILPFCWYALDMSSTVTSATIIPPERSAERGGAALQKQLHDAAAMWCHEAS